MIERKPPEPGMHREEDRELERLRMLRSCDVLDSSGDPAWDDYTLLAMRLCGTPIAVFTLVDENRQRFISARGLSLRETSRDAGFCDVVVRTGEPLVVPDGRNDVRFQSHELVKGESGVRFYAGMPLAVEGVVLGSLCVMDRQPREITPAQLSDLAALARRAITELELRRERLRMRELRQAHARIEEELQRRADHLDEAQHIAQVGSWEFDTRNNRIVWTPECYRIFGLQPDEFDGTFAGFMSRMHPDDREGFLKAQTLALRGESPLEFEYRVIRPNGEIRVVFDRGQLRGNPGDPGWRLAGTVRDITDQRQAERERQDLLDRERAARLLAEKAEAGFRVAFDNLLVAFVITDSKGNLVACNNRYREMLGYTDEEIRQAGVQSVTDPEDWPRNAELFRQLISGEIDHFILEKRYLHRNGRRVPARVYVSALPDQTGHSGTVAIILDISPEVEAMEELRSSQWLMRVAGQVARLGGWAYDVPSGNLILSDEVRAIFEMPAGRAVTLDDAFGFVLPEWRETLVHAFEVCRTEGIPYDQDLEIATATGRQLWIRALGQAERGADGQVIRILGALQDISEARSARIAAARIADKLQTTLESITDAFFTLDTDWRFTYLNAEAERLLARRREDLFGKVVWSEFPEAVGASFDIEYHRAMRDHVPVSFEEYYPPLERWFQVHAYPSTEGLAVYFQDVTERHRAQARLEAAWMRTRRIIESSFDVVALLDADGRFVDVNSRCLGVWGYTPAELVGHAATELVSENRRQEVFAAWERTRTGEPGTNLQTQSLRKDGQRIWVQWSCVWSEQDHLYFMVARDVTEQVAAEERTRQSQRLEAIGQLTGGVAHDFNNLLTVVMGSADLLTERLADQPPLSKLAEMIRSAAVRGADLTRGLLAFARRQALEPATLHVPQIIERLHALLRRTLSESISIETHCPAGVWPVIADPGQLESALLNLCLNARDAMPRGGHLHIETDNVLLDESYARQNPEVVPGAYVVIAVSDDGVGMTPEVIAHAFDPFFTTKARDKGTGLGLSMVYGFVKQSGGHVKIYSEAGHGTTVKLYVPRSQEEPEGSDVPRPISSLKGDRHILVVEDDDLVRAFAAEQLTSMGFHVIAARDAAEALEIVRAGAHVDLLFTDVVMPGGMNGPQLARAILELIPELPVLYTSGYTENAIVHQGRVDPGIHLLHKPYSRQALAERIHRLLAERENPPSQ